MSTIAAEAAPPIHRRTAAREAVFSPSVAIGLGIAALAWGPLLYAHGKNLWAKPHYEFFPLVILGSGLLAWNASKRLGALQPGKLWWLSAAGGLFSVLLLALAIVLDSPIAGTASFLFALLTFLYSYGGWTLAWRLFPAWLFLWLAVPPPFGLDLKLINWLQSTTAKWSSYFLDLFGVLHMMSGNIVDVPGKRLMVEQACSGINSLFAILTCSLFFVFWSRRGIVHAILLIAGGIGWVMVGNLIRVTVIALAWTKRGIDLSEGTKHDALGFAIFFVLLILVWSLDRLLLFVFATFNSMLLWRRTALARQLEMKLEQERKRDLGTTRWPSLARGWIFAKPALLALGLVACLNGGLIAMGMYDTTPLSGEKMIATFGQLDERFLAGNIGGWEMIGFNEDKRKNGDINGDYSRSWRFRKGDQMCVFSLDYAWTLFHDLQVCYDSTGWTVAQRNELLFPIEGMPVPDHIIEIQMTKPLGRFGYLLFTEVEGDGFAAEIPAKDFGIRNRLKRLSLKPPRKLLVYQTQLFTESFAPPTEDQKKDMMALYRHCRDKIAQAAPHKGEVQR